MTQRSIFTLRDNRGSPSPPRPIGWPYLDSYRPRGGRGEGDWIPLPIEGRRLERCYLATKSKDGELALKVEGHVPVRMPLGSDVSFTSLEGVRQWLHSIDDAWVGLLIEPADRAVTLIEAKILWVSDEPWRESYADAMRGAEWELNTCCDVRLGFAYEPRTADIGESSADAVRAERASRL